ncbi:hypothetical protein SAMN05421837_107332 [Amycolatopsis pretoriensis]|uniref:Uncharacterized protein n=1 Tax=Amycolatopsis pretoriensis TaxID=218821 RepID=A0A1H5R7R2_9PSEU|nr:hypothetical protein [Amycolatopsis pretoriensis]SEF34349.1 hypothetical protein SAMN05421837_107332 [Amycolatopsis pretoriensis]
MNGRRRLTYHGTAHGYKNVGCRCVACSEANRAAARDERHRRYARRLLVDGVWVAPVAAERHGRVTTYNAWGCRCEPCTGAASAERQRLARVRAERQRTARAAS